MKLLGAAVVLSAAGRVFAQQGSDSTASHCCTALEGAGLGDKLSYPDEKTYESAVKSYWSEIARIQPACFLQPSTAQDVSLAVSTLVEVNSTQPCQFAVRSGGHTTWAGAANIEDGVTIDMSLMSATTYNEEKQTVTIGPGARWESVYEKLDEIGVAVAGGRAATVGVGGLILGGGNSYYAARSGLVCDNVAEFEIVLANGEIAVASPETNSDLFKALKGGSNNFGIVTRFDMYRIEGGKLWGGIVLYPGSTAPQQISAFVNFGNNIEADPYGSAITAWNYNSSARESVIMNVFDYTKPVVAPPAYDEYLAIQGNISDTTRLTNMTSLAQELDQGNGLRNTFWTLTFVNDERVIEKLAELHGRTAETLTAAGLTSEWWVVNDMIQPIPTILTEHGKEKGGNVLGLDRATETLVLYQAFYTWHDEEDDEAFYNAGESLINELSEYAKSLGKDNEYLYLDYALDTQDPLKSYGPENVKFLKEVSAKYDPTGVFQTMMPGGFKISQVE